jgi:predicted phosphodiesterase
MNLVKWRKYPADVLVIAGDTANSPERTIKLLKEASPHYEHIVFVDGNHEHYSNLKHGRNPEQLLKVLQEQLEKSELENVTFLEHTSISIGDYDFIGVNGWYSMDALGNPDSNLEWWREFMNDDERCHITASGFSPRLMAARDAAKLARRLEVTRAAGRKAFVVTHTAPLRESLVWKMSHLWNTSNSFYMSGFLGQVLEENTDIIPYWVHGHTHYAKMYKHMDTEVIINPRGYPSENRNWTPVVLDV